MNSYPRESKEYQAVTVTVDGTVVTDAVELALASGSDRPATWAAATPLAGKIGVMVDGLAVGTWTVWARVTSSPEVPVIRCGSFQVT